MHDYVKQSHVTHTDQPTLTMQSANLRAACHTDQVRRNYPQRLTDSPKSRFSNRFQTWMAVRIAVDAVLFHTQRPNSPAALRPDNSNSSAAPQTINSPRATYAGTRPDDPAISQTVHPRTTVPVVLSQLRCNRGTTSLSQHSVSHCAPRLPKGCACRRRSVTYSGPICRKLVGPNSQSCAKWSSNPAGCRIIATSTVSVDCCDASECFISVRFRNWGQISCEPQPNQLRAGPSRVRDEHRFATMRRLPRASHNTRISPAEAGIWPFSRPIRSRQAWPAGAVGRAEIRLRSANPQQEPFRPGPAGVLGARSADRAMSIDSPKRPSSTLVLAVGLRARVAAALNV